MAGIVGRVVGGVARGVGGVVGLGQEAYQHNKDKKAAAAAAAGDHPESTGEVQYQDPVQGQSSDKPPSYTHVVDHEKGETDTTISSDEEDDEDLWLEDDAQTAIEPTQSLQPKTSNTEKWVDAFISRHPLPSQPVARLPAPVVIPQKRPGTRTRGFVKAYAPALEQSGVDQKAWMEVIQGFTDQTSEQNWFNVTNIAVALSVLSYTASMGPSVIVHFSALAVHTSIETGRRLYISKKTNTYLDSLNEQYFQPRGLYAMVMQYDPSKKDSSSVLDFESLSANAISKHTNDETSKTKNMMSSFKGSSGKTLESQIPAVCPLIFPDLDNASPEQQANGFKRAMAFAADYYDRRTQATFAAHHEGSKLDHERKPFASKYGDPNTFAHSGPIGMLTGGKVDPMKSRHERRMRRREEGGRRGGRGGRGGRRGPLAVVGTVGKGVRKVMQERVLYLMVVNMPTQEEMDIAAQMEARMKAEQPNWFEKFQASRAR